MPLWAWLDLCATEVSRATVRRTLLGLRIPQDGTYVVVDSFNRVLPVDRITEIQRHAQEERKTLGDWQTYSACAGAVCLAIGGVWGAWLTAGCWATTISFFLSQFLGCRVPQHLATPIPLLPRSS